jgi:hypothetical protein
MSNTLVNPMIKMPQPHGGIIDRRLFEKYTPGVPSTITEQARVKASESIGLIVAETLLAPLRETHEVTNMESVQRHFPGYDFLIHLKGSIARRKPPAAADPNRGLRIQVKSSAHPDWCGWQHRIGKKSAREYDLVVLIDAGLCTTTRLAHFREFPKHEIIDIYVLPKEIVDAQIDHPAQANRVMQFFSHWRAPIVRDQEIQFDHLSHYRDRFDLIMSALP